MWKCTLGNHCLSPVNYYFLIFFFLFLFFFLVRVVLVGGGGGSQKSNNLVGHVTLEEHELLKKNEL